MPGGWASSIAATIDSIAVSISGVHRDLSIDDFYCLAQAGTLRRLQLILIAGENELADTTTGLQREVGEWSLLGWNMALLPATLERLNAWSALREWQDWGRDIRREGDRDSLRAVAKGARELFPDLVTKKGRVKDTWHPSLMTIACETELALSGTTMASYPFLDYYRAYLRQLSKKMYLASSSLWDTPLPSDQSDILTGNLSLIGSVSGAMGLWSAERFRVSGAEGAAEAAAQFQPFFACLGSNRATR